MPGDRHLTRADLPDELTAETLRGLPLSTLRRLSRPGNGVLSAAEQPAFDAALHEVMAETAGRVSQRINRGDWEAVVREANQRGPRGGRHTRANEQLKRLATRIGEQVDVAEGLAPGVDWSFAQPEALPAPEDPEQPATTPTSSDGETVGDLEQRLTEQVELVQVMSEIADVSRRTFELEERRDRQETRGLFFGFVVSVAVLVAGWAPLVAADDWEERWWVIGLTLATCVTAAAVYWLIRKYQDRGSDDSAS